MRQSSSSRSSEDRFAHRPEVDHEAGDPTPIPPADLSNDILEGAGSIAAFLLGDSRHRRRIYHLVAKGTLPVFRLGSVLCARKSSLLNWIESEEARAKHEDLGDR